MSGSNMLAVRGDPSEYQMLMAVAGFLAGYTGNTRLAYQQDLAGFSGWCDIRDLSMFDVRRAHIELFARSEENDGKARATIARRLSTVAGSTGTASRKA